MKLGMLAAMALMACAADGPEFNARGELRRPANYRDWVFLSSGLGMTYGPAAPGPLENPRFDNVFVNPAAWAAFKQTGKWPEGTMFVLEIRQAVKNASINQGGFTQGGIAAVEASVKDSKRFQPGWAYFDLQGEWTAALPRNSRCNACHKANAALDNTFTQFYPAALEIAKAKGTLAPSAKVE